MRNRLPIISIMVFLLLAGCAPPQSAESNFNLIFRYGIGAKNELDTFRGTYTKDMVQDPSITVKISLSREAMSSIKQKMEEIGFFSYPDRFKVNVAPGSQVAVVTPYPSYYFKVTYNSRVKELWWEDDIKNPDVQASKLRELVQLIQNIIESTEEYKRLPVPKSGYL